MPQAQPFMLHVEPAQGADPYGFNGFKVTVPELETASSADQVLDFKDRFHATCAALKNDLVGDVVEPASPVQPANLTIEQVIALYVAFCVWMYNFTFNRS